MTPGGKAAAANVKAGDYLLAVNMQNLEEASLLNVMELIKGLDFIEYAFSTKSPKF